MTMMELVGEDRPRSARTMEPLRIGRMLCADNSTIEWSLHYGDATLAVVWDKNKNPAAALAKLLKKLGDDFER